MDMLNKLKTNLTSYASSTITNTVYNTGNIISGVLPGNPVTREFEVTAHIGSAGPSLLWKVYSGVKKSTKQAASVFVLERALLDRFEKSERELIWEMMKKGVGQLTRLRHPQILTVQHPLEESRDCLAFATEPVFASLANVLGIHDQLPSPIPEQLRNFTMFDIEIKYGLLQVSEGLSFLHNSAKMLHRNISPESVIINEQGAWKICGFEYCLSNTAAPGTDPKWTFPEYDHGQPPETYPELDFTAPEYAMMEDVTPAADMFSFGMLAFTVFNKKPIFKNNRNWGVFKRNIAELKALPLPKLFHKVPDDLQEYLRLLLSISPDVRPTSYQIQELPYFDDFGVKTLTSLDSQFQWDNLQKSQFYKGLPTVLPRLPARVTLHRVFPCLAKEFVNADMVPFVLPSALNIAQEASKQEYVQHILPALKPVMKMMEPIQILLIFMQRMDLLLEKTPPEDVKNDVLPMLYRALESDVSQIQEICLSIIPNFAGKSKGLLDRQSLKTALLPKIRKLCISTTLLSVRVNSLICIGKLLEHMDKWQVIDDVLPMLPQIPSKEPAVIMGIVGIYKLAFSNSKLGLTKEVMANKVLPFLIPLSVENGLTVAQYNSVTSIIREMMTKVETEHKTKLEQLNSIQDEGKKSLSLASQALPPGQLVPAPSAQEISSMDNMYSSLGLSGYVNPDKNANLAASINKDEERSKSLSRFQIPQPNSASNGLSLQEKLRTLPAQDSANRGTTSPCPTTSYNSNKSAAPMNKSMSMNQSMSTMSFNQPMSLNQSMKPMNQSMSMNKMPTSNSSWNQGATGSTWTSSSSAFGAFSSNSSQQMNQAKPDLSAFDDLLSPSANHPKPPMNSLQGAATMQPMMMNNTSKSLNQPQTNPLTFNDINDLLS